jgi:mannosyltransferase
MPHQRTTEALPEQSQESGIVVSLALMMLFCAGISLFFFSNQSLRLDEAQSLWQSGRSPADIFVIIAQDVHVPLYHLVLHFWRLYLGDTVANARLLSLVFYLLSIPALYLLGRTAYSKTVGVFASLLLALSPFMNWYGSEIRMYTLFTLLVILNQYFFVRLFNDRDSDNVWIGYAATALLGIYAHYFFFLNLVAQAIFCFLRRPLFPPYALKRFTIILTLLILAFIPWGWYVQSLGTVSYQEPALSAPTTINLFSTFSQFLFGFQSDHLNTFFLSLWPIALIMGFLTMRKNARLSPETEYFTISLVAAIVLAFVASFIVPLFVSRYLIFTIPSLYLLLASIVSTYAPRFAKNVRWVLVFAMLAALVSEIANPAAPVKENYETAVAYINSNIAPQDALVVSAPFTIYPVEYYYRSTAPLSTIPVWNRYENGPIPAFTANELPTDAKALANDHQNLWLLLSYDQGYEEQIRLYFDQHYQRTFEKNFSPDLTLYIYKLRYDTPLATASSTSYLFENPLLGSLH